MRLYDNNEEKSFLKDAVLCIMSVIGGFALTALAAFFN